MIFDNSKYAANAKYINSKVERYLPRTKESDYQTFSGPDIQAIMYLPTVTMASITNPSRDLTKSKVFANLQTISISSTRSVSPVRILGTSSPIHYTRGARTFAGTMVFASINYDVFSDVYDEAIGESMANSSTSMSSDQLPPFSIVLTAANEKGTAAQQIIHGITLVNYGTTYSIDDLYTETTYSYVATDVIPLTNTNMALSRINAPIKGPASISVAYKKLLVSQAIEAAAAAGQAAMTAASLANNILTKPKRTEKEINDIMLSIQRTRDTNIT